MDSRQNITNPTVKGNLRFDDATSLITGKSAINGSIDIVFPKDYVIELAAPYAYKINKLFFKLDQGTCVINLRVNEDVIIEQLTVSNSLTSLNTTFEVQVEDSILIEVIENTNSFGLTYSFHLEQLTNNE